MTIAPIKAGGWTQGEPLTPAQLNDFQAKLIAAGDVDDSLDARLDTAETDIDNAQAQLALHFERLTEIDLRYERPDNRYLLVEDFEGAIYDGTDHVISANYNWRVGGDTGIASINGRNGASRHPGLIEVSLPGNDTDEREIYFQLGDANDGWLLPTNLRELIIVVKIENHASNTASLVRIGLVQDNSESSGGTDALCLYYNKALSSTQWYLQRRKASGSSVFTPIGTLTLNQYVVVRLVKNGNDIDVYFNHDATPIVTVAAANIPIVEMLLGVYYSVASSDPQILKPSIDHLSLRADTSARQGT